MGGTVVHLAHRRVGGIGLGIGIHVASGLLSWRSNVGRRLPANVGHVGAAAGASRAAGLVLLQAGLQNTRGSVPSGVRGRSHGVGVAAGRGGSRAADAEVHGERAALEVLEVLVAVHAAGAGEVDTG